MGVSKPCWVRDKNTIQTELTWEFYWGKERESGERKGVQSGLREEKEIEKEGKTERRRDATRGRVIRRQSSNFLKGQNTACHACRGDALSQIPKGWGQVCLDANTPPFFIY